MSVVDSRNVHWAALGGGLSSGSHRLLLRVLMVRMSMLRARLNYRTGFFRWVYSRRLGGGSDSVFLHLRVPGVEVSCYVLGPSRAPFPVDAAGGGFPFPPAYLRLT